MTKNQTIEVLQIVLVYDKYRVHHKLMTKEDVIQLVNSKLRNGDNVNIDIRKDIFRITVLDHLHHVVLSKKITIETLIKDRRL